MARTVLFLLLVTLAICFNGGSSRLDDQNRVFDSMLKTSCVEFESANFIMSIASSKKSGLLKGKY